MDASRYALAPAAVFACLLALSAGLISLNPSDARPKSSPNEEKLPVKDEGVPKVPNLDPAQDQQVPNAPLAPVAAGLAQRTITLLAIKTIDFSPNGKLVAVGGGDGTVRVWEFDQQTLWNAEQVHVGWLFDLQFHPDGKSLVTGGGDNAIKIWSFGKEWKARLLDGHTDDLHGVAFTPDGKRVLSGSDDTTVRVWDLETGKDQILGNHDKQVTDVAVHPEGHLAASSSRDGTIRLWDLDAMKPTGVLEGHTADVLAIAFSPDGKQLASASYDKSVKVWDVESKQAVHTFQKHSDWAFCVAFSTDGKRLATGGGDKKIFVWDLETGELLQEIEQQADVSAVAFSPDGKHFVAGLIDGYLQLYRTGEELEHFGVIPPPGWAPTIRSTERELLSAEQFLILHTDLLTPESRTWDASVGKLTVSGNGFTLRLLESIDPEPLNAPKREMWTRARETLRLKVQREPLSHNPRRLSDFLKRLAAAELLKSPLAGDLKTWTMKEEIHPLMQRRSIRKELQRLRTREPVSSKPVERAIELKVHEYIDELFKEFPDEKQDSNAGDPPKVEEELKPELPERDAP